MNGLPDFSLAIVNDSKLENYLFNPSHIEGWPKGRFLIRAGFLAEDLQAVRVAFIAHVVSGLIVTTETRYGIRFECDGELISPTGESRRIRTVWQSDNGTNILRFVTFKPLRKQP